MVENYICLCVFAEAGAALMVRYTWHHLTLLAFLFVQLLPVLVQPFVHYSSPAIGVDGAPVWNHLQAIKLGIVNLNRNQEHLFSIYLKVLLSCQNLCLSFCHFLVDSSTTEGGVVVNVCLDAALVIQVRDTPFTGSICHLIRPFLLSWLASEEVLHKDTRYPFIYFNNVQ